MSKFIILPHWRIEGGAGYYIRDFIENLKPVGIVQVAGPYAKDYDPRPFESTLMDKLTLVSLPTYEGIRVIATIYHILFSLIRAIEIFFLIPRPSFKKVGIDVIVLTSSVQAAAIPIARRLIPGCRIAIMVQENVCLSRGFGRLTLFFLRRADVVVSITNNWAQHARENGLDPLIIPNSYELDYAAPQYNLDPVVESDLLYVGGGATIKGFDNLIKILPAILGVPQRRIVCLGHFNTAALQTLDQIHNETNSEAQLHIAGLVSDIRPYLRGTKLLILPIGNPHFCRPAIEAGLFGKTFVIPNFPELADFVSNGENCSTYEATNLDELVNVIDHLLQDVDARRSLETGNQHIAEQFSANNTQYFDAFWERLQNRENCILFDQKK